MNCTETGRAYIIDGFRIPEVDVTPEPLPNVLAMRNAVARHALQNIDSDPMTGVRNALLCMTGSDRAFNALPQPIRAMLCRHYTGADR